MPRPKTHDDALRVRLLDRAGELLSNEGPDALSLRRLAADVGTSTTAVYSLFGGKPALVRELYVEAFARFGERLRAVARTDDPAEDIIRLGLAYRRSALAGPHLYSIMFTKAVPGFVPDEEAAAKALASFDPLLDVVKAGIERGLFRPSDARALAVSAWGLVHGLVSLELNGNLPEGCDMEPCYEQALRAQVTGWRHAS